MCLITDKQPEVLTEDLETYKLVYKDTKVNSFSAIHYPFEYKTNVLYSTTIETSTRLSPFDDISLRDYEQNFGITNDCFYGKGFHSALSEQRLIELEIYLDFSNTIIVKCLIPKGSVVIYDRTGLLVSNQIKILE